MIKEGKTTGFVRVKPNQTVVMHGACHHYEIRVDELKLTHDAKGPLCLEAMAVVDWAIYQRCLEDEVFELTEANMSEALGEFQAGSVVAMTLFLKQALVPQHFTSDSLFEAQLLASFEGLSSVDEALNHVDAWTFLNVLQEVPEKLFAQGFNHKTHANANSHWLKR